MEKIVLFGGSFDPVTIEHINLIKALASRKDVKKVLVIPAYVAPHKKSSGTYFQHKLDMLYLALGKINKVEISLFEIEQKRAVYSYETVTHFKKIYSQYELCFAMGTDMLYIFDKWKNPEIIANLATVILFKRDDETISQQAIINYEKKYKKSIIVADYLSKQISSTEIRVLNMLGLPIEGYTLSEVATYIKQKNLYQGDRFYHYINQVLPPKRRVHTAGVIVAGLELAKRLNLDSKKVEIACLLHDNAKYLNYKDYSGFKCDNNMQKNVVHQFLGEFIAREKLNISDEEILTAIKYHTTGRKNMTLIEKVVFMADIIEKNRTFEGVETLRELTKRDFNEGFVASVKDLYKSLSEDKYYLTQQAYDYYVKGEK